MINYVNCREANKFKVILYHHLAADCEFIFQLTLNINLNFPRLWSVQAITFPFSCLICLFVMSFNLRCMLDFSHPNTVVEELTKDVETDWEHKWEGKEGDSLWQVENFKDRINPNIRLIFNDMQPAKICNHEER